MKIGPQLQIIKAPLTNFIKKKQVQKRNMECSNNATVLIIKFELDLSIYRMQHYECVYVELYKTL